MDWAEKTAQPLAKRCIISQLAFPYHKCLPASFRQFDHVLAVPHDIPVQLRLPVIRIGLGDACATFAIMSVPEAAVNEDHLSTSYERKVGRAGQVLAMKAEAIAKPVGHSPNQHFRLGALTPDPPHVLGSSLSANNIHGLCPLRL